jgi:Bacteriocin-protection, YdeI or OmpD-Associated/Domain of unknown function (DUF1905)
MPISKTFRGTLGTEDEGDLFIELPFDVRTLFGRARPPVVVTLKGHSWRSTVSVYSGRFYLPVSRPNRDAARVKVGDAVTVKVELDEAPRTVEPPPELAAALRTDARARAAWERLSFSHRREHAEAIAGAKKPDTRARRVAKALTLLRK